MFRGHNSFRSFSTASLSILGLAVVYFLSARLGLSLSFAHTNVSTVWPPTGIALAAILIFGYRVWPGIALGAFFANYWTEVSPATASIIAFGNTLEALVGAFLIRRFVTLRSPLYRTADVIRFILLAGMLSTAISATIGTSALSLGGFTHSASYGYLWWTWWLGDTLGNLVVAPFLVTWCVKSERWEIREQLLFLVTLILVLLTDLIVFGGWIPVPGLSLGFLTIPPLLLATFRFRQRGATASVLLSSVVAIWSTKNGHGPLFQGDLNESLLFLQVFMGIISMTALVLASVLTERQEAETAVRQSETKYRALAEQIPAVTYVAEFGEMGRWLYVSPQIESLLGFSPEEWMADPGSWYKQMHPDDRDLVLAKELESRKTAGRFQSEYRIFTRDGHLKWIRDDGVVLGGSEHPGLYQGILLDITDKKQGEEELKQSRENYEALVDSIDSIVWQADAHTFQFSFISKQAERLLGYPAERWLNEPTFWKDHIFPEDRDWAVSFCMKATAEKRDHEFEYRMIAADGRIVWLRDLVSVVVEKDQAVMLRGVMIEITEQKQAQALQSALYRIAEITSSAQDMQEFYSAIHAIVGELMYAKNLYIALYDEPTDIISFPYFVDELDDEFVPHKPGKGVTAYVLRSGEPLLATMEDFDLFVKTGEMELLGPPSIDWLGVPLKAEGKTIGVLAVQSYSETVRYQEKDKDVLTFVSRNIATALQRKRTEEALRRSEEQLRQAQKLKAIGQLAGGVAHDFNNTLMAITGYCDLLLMKLASTDRLRQEVLEIQKAAEHGASLTRQLLAFSRKQIMATKILDLNQVIGNMQKMLKPLIGEDIELVAVLDPALNRVKADPGQIEQVIVNLAVNARDAMPSGGKLIIETSNTYLDESYTRFHPDVTAADYVMLSFVDTGCGMDESTQSHVFEPFFTTKKMGTGLGLATVHGIVHQSGGHVTVQSEPGKGSIFKIYLPAVSQPVETISISRTGDRSTPCWQTVLLVDDNVPARTAVGAFLKASGFKIIEASCGKEALDIAANHDSPIHLLVTDVVMPQMNGRELARRLAALRPEIKILYISGYDEEAALTETSLKSDEGFVMKPFPMRTLITKIHELLA